MTSKKHWGFLHNIGTNPSESGDGDDKVNSCGITYRHSFSLIDFVQLFENGADSGTVIANLYMIKDPRALLAISNFNGPWNTNDTVRWTVPQRNKI